VYFVVCWPLPVPLNMLWLQVITYLAVFMEGFGDELQSEVFSFRVFRYFWNTELYSSLPSQLTWNYIESKFYVIHKVHFLTFRILTNKLHKLKYNKTHHKTHFILGTLQSSTREFCWLKCRIILKISDIQRTVHHDIFL